MFTPMSQNISVWNTPVYVCQCFNLAVFGTFICRQNAKQIYVEPVCLW